MIKPITLEDVKNYEGEALILRGCGGSLNEWFDGINEMLTDENILINGSKFSNCFTFDFNGLTCLGFPLRDVEMDIGKLAIWRLQTRDNIGGIWRSDFVDNYLRSDKEENEE